MCESEVEAITSFVGSRLQVFNFLFCCKSVPLLVPLLVAKCVVDLTENVQNNVEHTDPYQDAIPTTIYKY